MRFRVNRVGVMARGSGLRAYAASGLRVSGLSSRVWNYPASLTTDPFVQTNNRKARYAHLRSGLNA